VVGMLEARDTYVLGIKLDLMHSLQSTDGFRGSTNAAGPFDGIEAIDAAASGLVVVALAHGRCTLTPHTQYPLHSCDHVMFTYLH
jgi:hypothetical protein